MDGMDDDLVAAGGDPLRIFDRTRDPSTARPGPAG
jgi:hypothetical protein